MRSKLKSYRVLDMYARFCKGENINKKEESIRFGVDERSIQRDIDDIRAFLDEESSRMTNSEILAVSKILLESRAFIKRELTVILKKLIEGCVPQQNMKLVKSLIANEEYYFYMNAFIVEKDTRGRYIHKYDYPAIFRIDRIKEYKPLEEKFQVSYANRFEEGEFRKRIQFMYAGRLMKVQMKFFGVNPEPVLDRLSTAQIIELHERECIIEAEVYGKGVIMWLLSQGKNIEILKPESLREEVKKLLKEMYERYL